MKKAYVLSTCDTCRRILKESGWSHPRQDIKKENIDQETLEYLFEQVGSYEGLFNKRARKFKDQAVKDKIKKDADYKNLILSEYSFLKRPVFILEDQTFVGNAKATTEALIIALKKK